MPSQALKPAQNVRVRRGRPSLTKGVLAKIKDTQNVVGRTMAAAQRYKTLDIIGPNGLAVCVRGLESVYESLTSARTALETTKGRPDANQVLNTLQEASASLSGLFKTYGTERTHDLVQVCFGSTFETDILSHNSLAARYAVMCRYCHPVGYKVMEWKSARKAATHGGAGAAGGQRLRKNRIVEDFMIAETAESLDCFDLARTSKGFHTKVHGIKFAICDAAARKTLIVCALVDDAPIHCSDEPFVHERLDSLRTDAPGDPGYKAPTFERFICSLTLKELLVYSNQEMYDRYTGAMTQAHMIKQQTISNATRDFLAADLFGQRRTLMQLLLKSDEHEYQYLTYLLYDLLSTDISGGIDAHEQTLLFDSLPWAVKKHFHEAMRQTVEYTSTLANFDTARIPLEQQICLLKAPDSVKEKAMVKLREVKAKSEDSGSKARQYLEGLLRIPFGAYVMEPALTLIRDAAQHFGGVATKLHAAGCPLRSVPLRESYTTMELRKALGELDQEYSDQALSMLVDAIMGAIKALRRSDLVECVGAINAVGRAHGIKNIRVPVSGKAAAMVLERTHASLEVLRDHPAALWEAASVVGVGTGGASPVDTAAEGAMALRHSFDSVGAYMSTVRGVLDDSVHGHDRAKRQLERIIGQWVNGEQSGYCFGFEGPPGVGKTSLAKHGVAKCLQDADGVSRPFAFVAIGGSSNGSTLEGHNYTYVGSTWGRIVEVLLEKKCMNPIIFIDELDKVSRTEHGRELVGILTHLVDPTQNDAFQDKYFNGIDLDLSRALFIFSYNDVDAIDRVLLDRIHRIRFQHLTTQDKLAVCRKFLFPEIYKKMGVQDMISIPDQVLEHIISTYTAEAGVRKLKELLFEIIGEINLAVLCGDAPQSLPIVLSTDDVPKYLKGRHPTRIPVTTPGSTVGVISGLWASHNGQGGVLPIEAKWRPAEAPLDLKLTGMQGTVMKESMSVACTLACDLVDGSVAIAKKRPEGHRGLHVHVPEGATPKDGPSAGAAITTVLYSLLTDKPIRNDVAITGEICLQGRVTAIGGLDLKVVGGTRSGTKHFLYPKENQLDFDEMMEKHDGTSALEGISFTAVETIHDVLKIALADDQ